MARRSTKESKELVQKREIVEVILKSKGIDLSEWLNEQYSKVINENYDIIKAALEAKEVLDS